MASAFTKFQPFAAALANGHINLSSDSVHVFLLNSNTGGPPSNAASFYSTLSANEINQAGCPGYTTGGANVTVTSSTQTSGLYTYIASCANPTWTATGNWGNSFRYAIMYDGNSGFLIGYWDYGSILTLSSGNTFTIALDPVNGVFTLS